MCAYGELADFGFGEGRMPSGGDGAGRVAALSLFRFTKLVAFFPCVRGFLQYSFFYGGAWIVLGCVGPGVGGEDRPLFSLFWAQCACSFHQVFLYWMTYECYPEGRGPIRRVPFCYIWSMALFVNDVPDHWITSKRTLLLIFVIVGG